MPPPFETNYDLVIGNNMTSNVNTTFNLGQKKCRYLNVWKYFVACSNICFHTDDGVFVGEFSGSYPELRDKATARSSYNQIILTVSV